MRTTLATLKGGDKALILEVNGGRGVRQRLGNLGIHIGDTVNVVRSAHFKGPVLIEVNGVEVAIGQGMARKIEVEGKDK